MHELVLLYLALLLTAVACEDLRGLKSAGGPGMRSGSDGGRSDMMAEKMSDAALSTNAAILTATSKGKLANAASLGFKLASGATSASVTHGQMHAMEGGRHLLDRGPGGGMRAGSGGGRSDMMAEKMSDAALGTHAAILTATSKGKIANAASLGFKMAAAATNPSTSHFDMHTMEAGTRRLAAAGSLLSNRDRADVGALATMNAASSAIAKAVKTPNMGGAKYATDVGTKTSRVAGHTGVNVDLATGAPLRRLAATGGTYRPDAGAMDTALVTADVIRKTVKAPALGSAKFATHVGIGEARVGSGASKHTGFDTDKAAEEHPVRRMLSNRDRSGVGALDTMNAASNAIAKAVKTPTMGGAKFATAVGTRTSRVATTAHSGFDVDVASGGARRLLRQ